MSDRRCSGCGVEARSEPPFEMAFHFFTPDKRGMGREKWAQVACGVIDLHGDDIEKLAWDICHECFNAKVRPALEAMRFKAVDRRKASPKPRRPMTDVTEGDK